MRQPPTISSSSPADTGENNRSWIEFVLVPIGVIALFILRHWLDTRLRRLPNDPDMRAGQEPPSPPDAGTNTSNHDLQLLNHLNKLSPGDWELVFSKLFDSNRNQRRLKPSQRRYENRNAKNLGAIEVPLSSVDIESQEVIKQDDCGDESGVVQSSRATGIQCDLNILNEKTDLESDLHLRDEDPHTVLAPGSAEPPSIVDESNIDSSDHTTASCIICFEDLKVGETFVWSESNPIRNHTSGDIGNNGNRDGHGCSHVFHKTCMVRYLASNARRSVRKLHSAFRSSSGRGGNLTADNPDLLVGLDNPCPICRRRFCTLSQEDATDVLPIEPPHRLSSPFPCIASPTVQDPSSTILVE